jgi:hypothetical protein
MKTGKIRYFETSVAINLSAQYNNSEQLNLHHNYTDHDSVLTGNIFVKRSASCEQWYTNAYNSTDKQNNREIKNNINKKDLKILVIILEYKSRYFSRNTDIY